MTAHAFTALFPFGGLGAGARGFLDAQVRLLGSTGAFRCLGGIDFDAGACADFTYLTGAESWCTDVLAITADELRSRYGARAPEGSLSMQSGNVWVRPWPMEACT